MDISALPKLRGDSIDEWFYQVEYDSGSGGHKHINYFKESELDWTLRKKREDKLKQIGI